MNPLFEEAVQQARELSDEDQASLACIIMAEIKGERRWQELFDTPESERYMALMAEKALADDLAGLTEPLRVQDL